ncbi:MAG: hypothetical protein KDK36_22285 [Leptospiraceae bacterium]|nr:hypothetical protein [Leptospiraceae bacterium]
MTNKEFLSLLKGDYLLLEKSVKTLFKDYGFLHSLFQFIPPEFFLVLALSVCFLLILNTVSKRTSQLHLLFAVILAVGICVLANKYTMGRYRGWIYIKTAGFILIPAYIYSFFVYIISYAYRQYKRNKLSQPETIQQSLTNLHTNYNDAVTHLHRYLAHNDVDFNEVRDKLLALRLTAEGMVILLETKKQFKEEENFSPIDHQEA